MSKSRPETSHDHAINNILVTNYFNIFSDERTNTMSDIDLVTSLEKFFEDSSRFPLAKPIQIFTKDILQFMAETDPEFKKMRDKNLKDDTIVARLNKFAGKIKSFNDYIMRQDLSPDEKKMVQHVADLCVMSVNQRLITLKETKDRTYLLYSEKGKDLRYILADGLNISTHLLMTRPTI